MLRGAPPGDQSGVWTDDGSCVGSGPTPGPTPTAKCAPAWSASQVYVGGNQASDLGDNWTARWWTQGDTPGGQAGAWKDDGTCT